VEEKIERKKNIKNQNHNNNNQKHGGAQSGQKRPWNNNNGSRRNNNNNNNTNNDRSGNNNNRNNNNNRINNNNQKPGPKAEDQCPIHVNHTHKWGECRLNPRANNNNNQTRNPANNNRDAHQAERDNNNNHAQPPTRNNQNNNNRNNNRTHRTRSNNNNSNNNDADAHCIECNSESSDDSFMSEEQDFFQCEMELEPEYYQDSFSYVHVPMGSKPGTREALKIDKREKVSSRKTNPSQPGPTKTKMQEIIVNDGHDLQSLPQVLQVQQQKDCAEISTNVPVVLCVAKLKQGSHSQNNKRACLDL
jgi:hypothetical protein